MAWLRHFSRTARQMAEAENGVSALVMVQEEGRARVWAFGQVFFGVRCGTL